MFMAPERTPVCLPPMSAAAAQEGPMARSLPMKVRQRKTASMGMLEVHGTVRIATAPRLRPMAPTDLRPQLGPHFLITMSESAPPARQAATPQAKGSDVSRPAVFESMWRWFLRYVGKSVRKKLPL